MCGSSGAERLTIPEADAADAADSADDAADAAASVPVARPAPLNLHTLCECPAAPAPG
jgi:hypothetical protein